MEKMKAVALLSEKQAKVIEIAKPVCGPNEVMIKIHASALCTTEQRMFYGEKKAPMPFIGGHELAGEIVEVGQNVDKNYFKIGSKAIGRTQIACGSCAACKRGEYDLCEHLTEFRYNGPDFYGYGGLGEYIVFDKFSCWPVDTDLPYEQLALTEPISCVVNSINQGNVKLGDDALIIGGGVMGQLHNMILKKKGCRTIMSEPDKARREFALAHGCDIVINPLEENLLERIQEITHGNKVNAVFNTTAISAIAQSTIDLVAYNGTIVTYSSQHPDKPIEVSPNWLHYSKVKVTGSVNPSFIDFNTSINMLTKGIIDVKDLVSEVYPMEKCQEAFESALKLTTYRVVIKY